jgi:hypothetical protein
MSKLPTGYYSKWFWIMILGSISLIIGAGTPWSLAGPATRSPQVPRSSQQGDHQQQPVPASAAAPTTSTRPSTTVFAPFLDIVPSSNGNDVFISAGGVGELDGTLFASVGIGPGGRKGSYTMTYSDTLDVYVATATGFDVGIGASGSIGITSTLGLESETVSFQRAYVPYDPGVLLNEVVSADGRLRLKWTNADTIPFDTYIAIAPSFAPPGPAPQGHRIVGSTYSVRAADALVTSDKPMLLSIGFDDLVLEGADPHTLALFAWDAFTQRWDNLGGELVDDSVLITTRQFTAYAMMVTPAWRDTFTTRTGMPPQSTVALNPSEGTAVLSGTLDSGVALSLPITPTDALEAWGTLTFTGTVDPPTSTLTVDVLALDGTPLLTDLASGTRLDTLDPTEYPALRLRATLATTVAGQTPALDAWQLTWQVREEEEQGQTLYLPLLLR